MIDLMDTSILYLRAAKKPTVKLALAEVDAIFIADTV